MFVTRRKYNELLALFRDQEAELQEKSEEIDRLISERTGLETRYAESQEQLQQELDFATQDMQTYKELYESVENTITEDSELSSVEIRVDNNLATATPIIRFNTGIVDTLIDQGYITFSQSEDHHAIQLGLTAVANEVLSQIISAFEQNPTEIDYE